MTELSRPRRPVLLPDPSAVTPVPGPTRQRRPGLIAASALLVVAFAFAGVLVVQRAGHTVEVLVVARPVAAGQVLAAADLASARVGGDGFAAMPAADAASAIGKEAVVRLLSGQLLMRQQLTDELVPGPGFATVGLSLRPGQLPGDGLDPGDRVRVIAVAGRDTADAAGAAPADPPVVVEQATVHSTHPDPAAPGNTLITLVVPAGQADRLGAYGSAGQVVLVEVAR